MANGSTMLSHFVVRQAMRGWVGRIGPQSALASAVRRLIKFKLGALLVCEDDGPGLGVISKSDLMTCYYGGMPLDEPVGSMMVSPPETIEAQASLEEAMRRMRQARVHRLYVARPDGQVEGVLAYRDIVGLLFQVCRDCPRSLAGRGRQAAETRGFDMVTVREVMTPGVVSFWPQDSLTAVVEALAAAHLGAVLIVDPEQAPMGVVSSTDLLLAYLHGLPLETSAGEIMKSPAVVTSQQETLFDALHRMIFADISRLVVCGQDPRQVVGVLSLSDLARFSSGSCKACTSARLIMANN